MNSDQIVPSNGLYFDSKMSINKLYEEIDQALMDGGFDPEINPRLDCGWDGYNRCGRTCAYCTEDQGHFQVEILTLGKNQRRVVMMRINGCSVAVDNAFKKIAVHLNVELKPRA